MNPDSDIPRVSLRDIAARLGVSHSTVSLSLRDHPRISQAVKDRVRKAAGEMGYRPDPMLAALANYRRGRENHPVTAGVAWINGWQNPEELRDLQEFDLYWQGAFMAAEKSGFRLEEYRLGGECSPQRLHQVLSSRGIRGILLPPHPVEPDWQDFPWDQYSVIRFGRSLQTPQCHIVSADPVANTILAVRKIQGKGYRRIGFVALEGDLSKRGMRFELGFLGGQRLIRDEDPLPVLILERSNAAERAEALNGWLSRHKPDAILTPDPAVADLLNQSGLRVPEDIGLAVTSIPDGGGDAGIDPHPEEIGRVGFLMLHSLINDRARGIPAILRQIRVEGSWVDGESLPDRSVASNKDAAAKAGA
jgi:DNA-binding LacI/PurR family transcriptional regulator